MMKKFQLLQSLSFKKGCLRPMILGLTALMLTAPWGGLQTVQAATAPAPFPVAYLGGTTDTVTNLPAQGQAVPGQTYAVSSLRPLREGYEFIEWILEWEEEVPAATTDYVVHYVDEAGNKVAEDKSVTDQEVGTTVTETAIPIEGYTAKDPTEQNLTLKESGNEITFVYAQIKKTGYVVHYVDTAGNKVAEDKTVTDQEVGITVTETATSVSGYRAKDPTQQSLTLAEGSNEITFVYNKTYRVIYDPGIGSGSVPETKEYIVGETVTVMYENPDMNAGGKNVFIGFWYIRKVGVDEIPSDFENVYYPEDEFEMPDHDLTLYAVYHNAHD